MRSGRSRRATASCSPAAAACSHRDLTVGCHSAGRLCADAQTEALLIIGEIGGNDEEEFAAALTAARFPKPVFALIAEGTRIHVMSWPNHFPVSGDPLRNRVSIDSQAFAQMSKAFVVSACGTVDEVAGSQASAGFQVSKGRAAASSASLRSLGSTRKLKYETSPDQKPAR